MDKHKPENTVEDASTHCEQGTCAAFQKKYIARDIQAGVITATMAVPLSIGIAIMSDYPIQVGLATVAFASFIGWLVAWFKPGNYIGAPGIAAGLAPILAMGVSMFGIENMAFIVFLTALMQAIIWKYNWQRYILQIVPTYLVEGLLAGIGLKIALAFLIFTYDVPVGVVADSFLTAERITVIALSIVGATLFLYLFKKYKERQPAVPYFALIIYGVIVSIIFDVSMLHVEDAELALALPIPDFDSVGIWLYAFGFALMLAVIDVIEQVMSNAAIEKIDPLKRKCNSNNSLFSIWISNMGSSFFGGMTNLDGLAKSSTNRLAGAYTKFSVLIIALVITFFVINIHYLDFLPKFALGIIMIFVGIKMILGLLHVAQHGRYALLIAVLCGLLVYKVGIFEGLLIALAVHAIVNFVIFKERDGLGSNDMVRNYISKFKQEEGLN